MQAIVLYHELNELLARAACAWGGVSLAESAVAWHTREITTFFDYAGRVTFCYPSGAGGRAFGIATTAIRR